MSRIDTVVVRRRRPLAHEREGGTNTGRCCGRPRQGRWRRPCPPGALRARRREPTRHRRADGNAVGLPQPPARGGCGRDRRDGVRVHAWYPASPGVRRPPPVSPAAGRGRESGSPERARGRDVSPPQPRRDPRAAPDPRPRRDPLRRAAPGSSAGVSHDHATAARSSLLITRSAYPTGSCLPPVLSNRYVTSQLAGFRR